MAATAVLLFVLNKVFDCLGSVWSLNEDEMNGDVSHHWSKGSRWHRSAERASMALKLPAEPF